MIHITSPVAVLATIILSVSADPKFDHLTAETSVNLQSATSASNSWTTTDVVDAENIAKRKAADWELQCTGQDMFSYDHMCFTSVLNGAWCQNNCHCVEAGGINCKHNLQGCDAELIYSVCKTGSTDWKCVCRNKNNGLIKHLA